jgi:hypothetical protein
MSADSGDDWPESRAGFTLTLNNFFVVVGSTKFEWDSVGRVEDPGVAIWNNEYVLVTTAAQSAPVSIRVFLSQPPPLADGRRVVFDGFLDLHDGQLRVGDPVGSRYLVCRVAVPGRAGITIWTEVEPFPAQVDIWVH